LKVTLLETPIATRSAADRRAAEHYRANLEALKVSQPTQSKLFHSLPDVPWLFARDGSLTARDKLGPWWAGCSLPLRAGKALLKKLDVRGVAACMLAPTHAGQVVATLGKLQPQQALIVIQPDATEARVMLSCGDFASDIQSHRLWLAAGEDWAAGMRKIFDDFPGLPTPSQFIRLPVTAEEISTPLIRVAEQIFNEVNAGRLLLVAPSHFRLWDDAGHTMIQCLASENDVVHLDPDDPAQSSSLGLAISAADCGVLLVADRVRTELSVLPRDISIITWITQPRIPNFDPQHPHDALLLADEQWLEPAKRAGWPSNQLSIAHWPPQHQREPSGSAAGPVPKQITLSLITDTHSLETPVTELELSSHHVLWESIRADILANPFSVQDSPTFIDRRRKNLGIADEGFNPEFFLNRLVIPAYQQAIVARLLNAKIPVRLYGKGWTPFPDADHGPIATREDFLAAASASALVFPWPVRHRHAIDAMGRPVLGPHRNEADLIREARRMLITDAPVPSSRVLSAESLRTFLDSW
jgi:hypothetical protein